MKSFKKTYRKFRKNSRKNKKTQRRRGGLKMVDIKGFNPLKWKQNRLERKGAEQTQMEEEATRERKRLRNEQDAAYWASPEYKKVLEDREEEANFRRKMAAQAEARERGENIGPGLQPREMTEEEIEAENYAGGRHRHSKKTRKSRKSRKSRKYF